MLYIKYFARSKFSTVTEFDRNSGRRKKRQKWKSMARNAVQLMLLSIRIAQVYAARAVT